MIATVANLEKGMRVWTSRTGWPRDFHAPLYLTLLSLKRDGLSERWWSAITDHLATWGALRPQSKQEILEKGLVHIDALRSDFDAIERKYTGRDASLAVYDWRDLKGLFQTARAIKGSSSPVFASKLCHFILPEAFPVIDGEFIGLASGYRDYWDTCRDAWIEAPNQTELRAVLQKQIPELLAPVFPWSTKIAELCVAGSRT